ncbi:hypothetical protein [Microbacterium sp. NC79]|uniref:hypothetical protein n=1 Tax=Microbacterium sp. NC79 TaxID=2851009 RepID=UPI001C2C0922|nr:hypothetical protein [Microbacterium sp. NC79]MBV0894037.1 hypothetical protein [Microbacterium sp. NC79]
MTTLISDSEQRRICIRMGDQRRDIIAPESMSLIDVLRASGATMRTSERIYRERSGDFVDPRSALGTLNDGDVVAIVDTRVAPAQRRARHQKEAALGNAVFAWWLMAIAGLIGGAIFFFAPVTQPAGWMNAIFVALVAASVVSAVLYVRRHRTDKVARGAVALGPAALVAAWAVTLSSPAEFSPIVTLITVAIVEAVYFSLIAVLARYTAERAQLNSLGAVAVGVALVLVAVLVLNLRDVVAACVIVGAAPLVLRALPTTMMHVPPGAFIDFAEHQEARFAVREVIPAAITTVDVDRVTDLVARSTARMQVITMATCALVVMCIPFVVVPLSSEPLIEMIGRLVLVGCVVLALALGARRFSSRVLKAVVRATAFFVGLITIVVVFAGLSEVARWSVAIGFLLGCVAIAASVILLARGARSVYWSRFADIVEGMALVFALPAAFVGAGLIQAVQGAMN